MEDVGYAEGEREYYAEHSGPVEGSDRLVSGRMAELRAKKPLKGPNRKAGICVD